MQDISFPFEFVIEGTPVSLQASGRSREAWKTRVKGASLDKLPDQHVVYDGSVAVEIFYFPSSEMVGDIDNIVKPILDALCRHVYFDDRQVVRVVVQKFEPDQPAAFSNPSAVLMSTLVGTRPITYVRITDSPFGIAQ